LEKIVTNKKKVLVLGGSGMIGHVIYSYLNGFKDYEIIALAGSRKYNEFTTILDVRNIDSFELYIKNNKPDIVINCIGLLIEDSNNKIKDSIYLNAYFPHYLKEMGLINNFKLIHISTDCVFSGYKNKSYVENDIKDGETIYAKTKGLGEIIDDKNLTLRTSVIGPELKFDGNELFNWFMNQQTKIFGYTNAFWSGITSMELGFAVKWSIENNITGLYNLTNGKKISKYELLKLFNKHTQKNILIKPTKTISSDKSFTDTRKLLDYQIPSYDLMVKNLVDYIQQNKNHYPHYIL
jgi:dTDP-4-dehydrorhamnose reductase